MQTWMLFTCGMSDQACDVRFALVRTSVPEAVQGLYTLAARSSHAVKVGSFLLNTCALYCLR